MLGKLTSVSKIVGFPWTLRFPHAGKVYRVGIRSSPAVIGVEDWARDFNYNK